MLNNGKHGQGTHSTKMSADSPAENTPNALKDFSPKCLPKPKSSRLKKALSVVPGLYYLNKISTVLSGLLEMKAIKIQKRFAIDSGPVVLQ